VRCDCTLALSLASLEHNREKWSILSDNNTCNNHFENYHPKEESASSTTTHDNTQRRIRKRRKLKKKMIRMPVIPHELTVDTV